MKKYIHQIFTNKIVLATLIIGIFSISTVYALNTWNTGYRVNNGASTTVYVAGSSNYRVVTNTSGMNLFIPSKTTGEMNRVCDNPSGVACYTCSLGGWVNNGARGVTIDHDTGAGSVGHSQAWCSNWCRGILDGAKDTGTHLCVRRSNGRCHLYRDESTAVAVGGESGRSYQTMSCSNS